MTKSDKIELLRKRINTFFNVDITTKSRESTEVYARAIYYNICKMLDPTMTTMSIGKTVNRDHSTVVFTLNKFTTAYEYDKKFKQLYDEFIQEHPMYLKEYVLKNRHTKDVTNIIDFIYSLDIIKKINFMQDLEKLKLTYITKI